MIREIFETSQPVWLKHIITCDLYYLSYQKERKYNTLQISKKQRYHFIDLLFYSQCINQSGNVLIHSMPMSLFIPLENLRKPEFMIYIPACNYMFKVNNRTTRTRCEIRSKLTTKTTERCQWRRLGVFIVNFDHIPRLVLLFLLLTLSR